MPKELLHEFCHHHETENCATSTPGDGLAVSTVHKHCLFLDHASEPTILSTVDFTFIQLGITGVKPAPTLFTLCKTPFSQLFLRGPPAVS